MAAARLNGWMCCLFLCVTLELTSSFVFAPWTMSTTSSWWTPAALQITPHIRGQGQRVFLSNKESFADLFPSDVLNASNAANYLLDSLTSITKEASSGGENPISKSLIYALQLAESSNLDKIAKKLSKSVLDAFSSRSQIPLQEWQKLMVSLEKVERDDPFAKMVLTTMKLSENGTDSFPLTVQLQQTFAESFSTRYNLSLSVETWQQQLSALASISPPGWKELSGNISALPLPDLQYEVGALLPTDPLGQGPRTAAQASLAGAVAAQLGRPLCLEGQHKGLALAFFHLSASETIRVVLFYNSPEEALAQMPYSFDVQVGENESNQPVINQYKEKKNNTLFGSGPLSPATVKIARQNKLFRIAQTTAKVLKQAGYKPRMSQEEKYMLYTAKLFEEKLQKEFGVDVFDYTSKIDPTYLRTRSMESILDDIKEIAKEYLPTEAVSKLKDEIQAEYESLKQKSRNDYESQKQRILAEYSKIVSGLRSEVSRWISAELASGGDSIGFASSPGPDTPPIFDLFDPTGQNRDAMRPKVLPRAVVATAWEEALDTLRAQPKIGPAVSTPDPSSPGGAGGEEGGRNYPLLLHTAALLAQAPYNLERNRIDAAVLEEVLADLGALLSGGLVPARWARLLGPPPGGGGGDGGGGDGAGRLFPGTARALAGAAARATGRGRRLWRRLEDLVQRAAADPAWAEALASGRGARRAADVFAQELRGLLWELDPSPELRQASGTLDKLRQVLAAAAAPRVARLGAGGASASAAAAAGDAAVAGRTVPLLVARALGREDASGLEVLSVTSDRACAVYCRDAARNLTTLSFRGTKDSTDVLTDATFAAAPVEPWGPATGGGREAAAAANGMQVHRGFGAAFESIEQAIAPLLDRHPNDQLLLAGHSMGGALAQLAAARFAARGPALVTFAAPAIGNRAFCRHLERTAWPHGGLRVWNEFDVVPSLAQLVGYGHAGVPIRQRLPPAALQRFEEANAGGSVPGFAAIAPHVLFQLGPAEYVFPVLYSSIGSREEEGAGESTLPSPLFSPPVTSAVEVIVGNQGEGDREVGKLSNSVVKGVATTTLGTFKKKKAPQASILQRDKYFPLSSSKSQQRYSDNMIIIDEATSTNNEK